MKGLSTEIEYALNTIIEGLNYNFFSPNGTQQDEDFQDIELYVQNLDPEKMKVIMESKVSSFNSAKKILDKWMNSPNAPNVKTIKDYLTRVISAGDVAIDILRKALAGSINFDELDPHKHNSAIKAKPLILEAIFDLDTSLYELREKLESDDLTLSEREFRVGFPERFAKGEFYPMGNYWKDWYDDKKDSVKLCPFSTTGKMITLDDLNITLPKPPDKKDILFSDLPKKDQFWRRSEMPRGVTPDNKEQWDEYIREEFRRRREGLWFMNNGEPVFLTGNHYFALQWVKMLDSGGYMDFRYAQLNMFYHLEACIIDDRSIGQLFVKSRRTGFTYIVLSIMLNHSTSTRNNNFGITSKSDTDAKKAFLKYRYMLLNLPFFFIPLIKGKLDSPKEFEFASPLSNTKESKKNKVINKDEYLNNMVDYEPTKNDSYDGQALYMYLGDEAGKWKKPMDYIKHFGQISPTMLEGGTVVGKAFIGSTVGALNKGGQQFKDMHASSNVASRNEVTGMTNSGLYRYFLAAQDNMSAFTDIYGVCHKTKPSKKTYNVKGKLMRTGSIQYLMSQEDAKRAISDNALNEQYRAYPRTIDHAFRDEATESVFNITKIYEQIEYNDAIPSETRYTTGNFDWVDGVTDGDVVFNPNPNGRFKVSWLPSVVDGTEGLANRVREVNGKFFPLNKECVRIGVDPFSLKSTHGEGSKGAAHGLTLMFPEGGAPSNKWVFEYLARPSDETIFFEDMIKVMRYYGAPALVESNRIDLLRHMRNRGYRGFAMDRLDRPKNKLNPNEIEYGGQVMSGKDILDSHMNSIGAWIEKYVGVYTNEAEKLRTLNEMGDMVFNETLKDWLGFDPDKRTKYDATISSGLAVMACQTEKYRKKIKKKDRSKIVLPLLKRYDTSGNLSKKII